SGGGVVKSGEKCAAGLAGMVVNSVSVQTWGREDGVLFETSA
nr:hypothetical protein [Tanacetum cinerariifolium]